MALDLTEEQRRELNTAADGPLPLSDPEAEEAYPLVDEAFREGWDDPKMAEYDRYEEYRRS